MRKTIDWIIFAAIIGGVGLLAYTHQAEVQGMLRAVENKIKPCSRPLTYSVGSIDPGFGLASSILVADLKLAEEIWETPSGKNLFEYKPMGGAVTVSLIYDDRQASTNKLKAVGQKADQIQATYEALKARYDTLSAYVKAERAEYENMAAAYKNEESVHNAAVAKWNQQGRGSKADYDRLQADRAALGEKYAALQSVQAKLKADIDSLNALVTQINQHIAQYNMNIELYNQVGADAGEFEEGRYQFSRGIQTIHIYEYSNHTQLVRILAHEMGHALSLDHVSDPEAIMYRINRGTSLKAATADILELDRVCSSGI